MRNYRTLSDKDLVLLLRKDKIPAFAEIYERYWSVLYAAAWKRIKSKELAEEIVQDLFTGVWINRNEITIHTSLKSYLLTSIRYRILNHIEKELVRRRYRESLQAPPGNTDNVTEETVYFHDLRNCLEQEISQLPPRCRQVFELSRKACKTHKEIAAELNISEKTVENHLTKAISMLRTGLKEVISLLPVFLFC